MAEPSVVSWEVLMDDNTWSRVSSEDCLVLETQLVADPVARFELPMGTNRWLYHIDLRSMTQTNTKSGRHRALRRLGPSDPVGGEAELTLADVLAALRPYHRLLGGTPHTAGRSDPHIPKKLKRAELSKSSDYEYIFMTVLGFQALQAHGDEITRLNNGAFWKHNPGTMRVEEVCGFTMHGDREGANGIVRSAPGALLRAFAVARRKGTLMEFFQGEAFDRLADPCLEGRLGRILAYLEHHAPVEEPSAAPCDELVLAPLPHDAPADRVIGEHLRVFRNTCVHEWAKAQGLTYERAKELWKRAESGSLRRTASGTLLPEVDLLCNEATFRGHLAAKRAEADGAPVPPEAVEESLRFYVRMGTLCPAPCLDAAREGEKLP